MAARSVRAPRARSPWLFWCGVLLVASSAVEYVQIIVVDPRDWPGMVQLGSSGALAVALAWASRGADGKVAAVRAGAVAFAVFALGLLAIWVAFSVHAGSVSFFHHDLGHPFGRGSSSSDGFVTRLGDAERSGGFQGDPILGSIGVSVSYGAGQVAWVVVAPLLGVFARRARTDLGHAPRRAAFAMLAAASIWLEFGRSVHDGDLVLAAAEGVSLVWLAWALLRQSGAEVATGHA